ncbi:FAD-binding protein [Parapusillimonas sp. SGNA-6]|nr:FAD-binding protein [Parapusillimonas sp. SGNA-6]
MNSSQFRPAQSLRLETTDVLVLGSGIAGYQAAKAAAGAGVSVTLAGLARGASPFVLGFNICLDNGANEDTIAQYYEDTFQGGYGIGNAKLVSTLAHEAREAFTELQGLGVPFETTGVEPAFRHLSGSRYPRSVYVKAGTGNAILEALARSAVQLGVKERLGLKVVTLLKVDERVCGALLFDKRTGELTAIRAANTVLATGGIGRLYGDSTYPADISGDSYGLALDAGATLIDMEFVQFEPTVVATPEKVRGMEMPTAMMGDGAVLLNTLGERFMCRYNPGDCEKRIEKAKIALFIQSEIDEGRGTDANAIYFDARGLGTECLQGYVTHYKRLLNAGVDPAVTPVQVHPAAHSLMGGVRIDHTCHSGIEGLLVCGEAAGGVHGASRIAGNGASDVIVFGRVAGRHARQSLKPLTHAEMDAATVHAGGLFALAQLSSPAEPARRHLENIQRIMSTNVGIRRSGVALQEAVTQLQSMLAEIEDIWDGSPVHPLAAARRAAMAGIAISHSAMARTESRGAHFRTDFPQTNNEQWKRSNLVSLDARGGLQFSDVPRDISSP